jgi:hypothetical protein
VKSFAVKKLQKFKNNNNDDHDQQSTSTSASLTNQNSSEIKNEDWRAELNRKFGEVMSGTSHKLKEFKKNDHFRKEINEFDKTHHRTPLLNSLMI